MPDSSASATAAWLTFSGSIRLSVSCASRIGRASATVMRPGLGRLGHDLLEHPLEVHLHLFDVPRAEDRDRGHGAAGQGDLDLAVLELAGVEPGLHLLARPLAALGGLVGLGRVGVGPRGRRRRGGAGRAAAARPAPAACSATRSRSRGLDQRRSPPRPGRGPGSRRRGRSSRPRCTWSPRPSRTARRRAWPAGGRSRSCPRRSGRSAGCSWA